MTIKPLTLSGNVICLAPLSPAHLEALCAVGLDPELWQATTIHVRTKADMAAYIQSALDGQSAGTALPFVIIERASGTVIGTTRYHSMVPEHRRLEIGFTWIGRPWQRTAANTEAKLLLLRQAFDEWQCLRVEFRADAENEPSRRALLRIGAKLEGILRNYRVSSLRGIRDLAVYSIIAAEWPKIRADLEAKLNADGF